MMTPTLRFALRNGVCFGLLFSLAVYLFAQVEPQLTQSFELPNWWKGVVWMSLLTGSLWGAFLYFNERYPGEPLRFIYLVAIGTTLGITAAFAAGFESYWSALIDPHELRHLMTIAQAYWIEQGYSPRQMAAQSEHWIYANPRHLALTAYNFTFFMSFAFSLCLAAGVALRDSLKE